MAFTHFEDSVINTHIDYEYEMKNLLKIFYHDSISIQNPNIPIRRMDVTIRQYINDNFRGNLIDSMVVTLDDFDEKHHFNFLSIKTVTEETLIEFSEYCLNEIEKSGVHYPSDLRKYIDFLKISSLN